MKDELAAEYEFDYTQAKPNRFVSFGRGLKINKYVILNMETENTVSVASSLENHPQRTLREIATHGLAGALVGLLFALIPLSFAWGSDSFTAIHAIVSVGFVAFCGVFSAVWGEKFIDRLLDLAQFMPPI